MKTIYKIGGIFLFLAVMAFFGVAGAGAQYMQFEGVEGETSTSATGTGSIIIKESSSGVVGQTFVLDGSKSQDDGRISKFSWKQVSGPSVRLANATSAKASFVPTVAGTYVFELSVTDATGRTYVYQKNEVVVSSGSSTAGNTASVTPEPKKGGDVEFEWKVEEGESIEGVEPDEIDYDDDDQPITPDFSILLGGGGSDDEEAQEARDATAEILKQGMAEEGRPVETLSLNFEKIKIQVKHELKLFGFVSAPSMVTIDITPSQEVKVKFPWWAFLATGKDETLGQQVFNTLSNVLKTKHDTIKNSIGNVR